MSRLLLPVGFAACLGLVAGLPATAAAAAPPKAEEELVDKVRKSIDSGVRYLKSQQNPQGNWEGLVIGFLADMEGGSTALVTLALLNCGVPPDDPAVKRAIDYLRKLTETPKKTYVVALCNLVFAEVRDPKDRPLVQKNADWLVRSGLGWKPDADGRVAGELNGWSYPQNQIADNSNTQYALLGLYAAKQAGAKLHESVWAGVQKYYSSSQIPVTPTTGAWPYYNARDAGGRAADTPSISMTVAGVCGLLIARMGLDSNEHGLDPRTGVAQNCGAYSENPALVKGMNWVAANFTFDSPKSMYYNVYGIERLGRLSGQRFIGSHDWYREGCEKLIAIQQRAGDGSFAGGKQVDATAHLSTAFSLLFLSKGRTPVLVSKFAWGTLQTGGTAEQSEPGFPAPPGGANWNRKHNDTRHVVEFCSRELFNGTPLSWQVYDARRRAFDNEGAAGKTNDEKILEEVGLLLQSPVLYLNGHGPLILTPAQEKILKTYIEEGGFIVAEACCGDEAFAASFRKLVKKLFETNLQKMSPDHAILKMFPGVLPTDFPELEVLNRGCRTVAVFSPVPLAGYWEESKYMPKDSKNPANRGEKAFCLIRNIVAYATGMELPKPKLSKQVIVRGVETGVTRSHFKAVQLKIEGDPEPAPDALKNLMGYLRDNARLEVALNSVVLPAHDDQLFNFKFMYLHGRKLKTEQGGLVFQPDAIEAIQSNLNSGGLLFADAACGGFEQWKAFDKSFRELCAKLYPDRKLELIPEKGSDGKEDPLYRVAREAGLDLKHLRCRRELPDGKGGEAELRAYPAHLEGIKIDGRWVVVYSKYDVGCAIEGHKSADCLGYDKESALRIAGAVVLYSLKR
ncbi:DUF4159 domain-containing protein [Gemmata sp.]|uniref:DUF4159 domain-containing protein n=1 Tax=Gemmata sp. TaxID=1914242 RepID=UPI003F72A636